MTSSVFGPMTKGKKGLAKFLDGKKSYLTAITMFIVGGLYGLKIIDDEQLKVLMTVIAGFGTWALRQAIKKLE